MGSVTEVFRKFAHKVAALAGSFYAFAAALFLILAWAVTGPVFGFSDTWQLVINTGTTIITFLMVFLIQNTQYRDNRAIQTKLDEIIVHMVGADNRLVRAEDFSDEQLNRLKAHFDKVAGEREEKRQRSNRPSARSSSRRPKQKVRSRSG
jgi:low affinity Fe/Cu permease